MRFVLDCTEMVETFLPGTEEMRPSIYSQLVTGVRVFNLPVDKSKIFGFKYVRYRPISCHYVNVQVIQLL